MVRIILTVLLVHIFSACIATPLANEPDVASLYGKYVISGFKQYGGGRTTEEYANNQVGNVVYVFKDEIRIYGKSIKSPIYKIEKVKVDYGEGNIVPRDLSVFYGYKRDRKAVVRLLVYDKARPAILQNSFEIFDDGTLLNMHDGHFYFMKKL